MSERGLSELSVRDFREGLTPERVRLLQIMSAALAGGVVMMALVVAAMVLSGGREPKELEAGGAAFIRMLSIVNAVLTLGAFTAGSTLFGVVLRSEGAEEGGGDPVARCFARMQTAWIVRLAVAEGAALFGAVVCLLAHYRGVLAVHPVYWLNMASPALFVVYVLLTFPTPERLEQVFENDIAGKR